jgi:hypothetical protein
MAAVQFDGTVTENILSISVNVTQSAFVVADSCLLAGLEVGLGLDVATATFFPLSPVAF